MSVETDPGWDRVRIILDCDSEPSFGSARFEYFSNPARVRITLPGYLKGLNEGRTTVTDSFLKTVVVDKISRNQFQVTAYLASPVDRAEVDFYSSSRMEFAYIDIPRPARYRQPWWTFSEVKRAKDSGIPVVVIDPGHGGYDPGAICRFNKSLHEKEVALDIGREVARTLKRNGVVYPVLTRSGDYYPTLDERVELIKNTAADLFVSVHADSAPDSRTANGFAVWTLDRTKNNFRARANQTSKYGWQNALDRFPPSQQAVMMKKQSSFVEHETEVAAKIMTTAMDRIPNLENRGFKPHDYNLVVLRHDYAPSFLVEAGFLSNSGDSQKLNSHSFRKRIGQEIARGIEAYFAQRSLAHRNAPIRPRITVASFTEDPTPRFTGQTFEYRVRRNETLKGLAQRFDVTVDEILIASGKPLSKTIIYVDEVLRIPTHPSQTSITPPSIRSQRTREIIASLPKVLQTDSPDLGLDYPGTQRYEWRNEDTPLKVALRFGITERQLANLNGWSSPSDPTPGDVILVPAGEPNGDDSSRLGILDSLEAWAGDESVMAAAVEPAEARQPEVQTESYKVRPGDTLSEIASRYGVDVRDLRAANSLKDDTIQVGETLRIAFAPDQTPPLEHSIRRGESLEKLAKQYGTSVRQLKELNGLKGDRINAGDVLRVR